MLKCLHTYTPINNEHKTLAACSNKVFTINVCLCITFLQIIRNDNLQMPEESKKTKESDNGDVNETHTGINVQTFKY